MRWTRTVEDEAAEDENERCVTVAAAAASFMTQEFPFFKEERSGDIAGSRPWRLEQGIGCSTSRFRGLRCCRRYRANRSRSDRLSFLYSRSLQGKQRRMLSCGSGRERAAAAGLHATCVHLTSNGVGVLVSVISDDCAQRRQITHCTHHAP